MVRGHSKCGYENISLEKELRAGRDRIETMRLWDTLTVKYKDAIRPDSAHARAFLNEAPLEDIFARLDRLEEAFENNSQTASILCKEISKLPASDRNDAIRDRLAFVPGLALCSEKIALKLLDNAIQAEVTTRRGPFSQNDKALMQHPRLALRLVNSLINQSTFVTNHRNYEYNDLNKNHFLQEISRNSALLKKLPAITLALASKGVNMANETQALADCPKARYITIQRYPYDIAGNWELLKTHPISFGRLIETSGRDQEIIRKLESHPETQKMLMAYQEKKWGEAIHHPSDNTLSL